MATAISTTTRRLPAPGEGSALARRSDAPTRRGVLGGAAFLSALAAGGVAAAEPSAASPPSAPILAAEVASPDANLIRWAEEAIEADQKDVDLTNDLLPEQRTPEIDAESKRLMEIWRDRMTRCIGWPARTPEGLRAKARLLHNLLPKDAAGSLWNGTDADWDEQLTWSLVQDVLMGRA